MPNDAKAKAYLWAAGVLERHLIEYGRTHVEDEHRARLSIMDALRYAGENRAAAPEVPPPGPMVAPGYAPAAVAELEASARRVRAIDRARAAELGYAPPLPSPPRPSTPKPSPPAIVALPPVPAPPCPACGKSVNWSEHHCRGRPVDSDPEAP